jgi:serine/threonine-protein kinase
MVVVDLAELKKKREQFLLTIYELAQSEANIEVSTIKVAELMGIDYDAEAPKLGGYWRGKRIVDWGSFERIFLTPNGVDAAERIIEANEQQVRSNPPDKNIKCPDCREEIRAAAKFCEYCGLPLNKFNATTLAGTAAAATTLASARSLIGSILVAKYEIIGELGQGGGGAVYLSRRILIGDEVAIKVLHDRHFTEPQFRNRFRREAIAAAKIHHPNIVAIYDFSEGDGNDAPAFLVMELVKGESLDTLLKREGHLQPIRAITLLREVCAGVGAAHAVGVFHRDLKPSNIIILPASSESTTESVKIIDFGIAKFQEVPVGHAVTEIGAVKGTPLYMSPEQFRGELCDARSDVYSLGVILYELVVGKPPFTATNNADISAMHLHEPPPGLPPHLGVSPELERVLMRALAKEPNARQADASELSNQLKNALHFGRLEPTEAVTSEPLSTFRISRSEMVTDLLIEETDDLVFKTSCEKALKVGHLKHTSVTALVKEFEPLGITKDEVLDALEILTHYGYIEPSKTVGCGLRICDFEITTFGLEQYAVRHISDYEGKRKSVILDIVSGNKQEFQKPDLITTHILDTLALDGLIQISKPLGRVKVMYVSAQLRRKYKDYKATVEADTQGRPLKSRASKLAEEILYKQERDSWLRSVEGREDAKREVARLFDELLGGAKELNETGIEEIQTETDEEECKLRWRGISLVASWNPGRFVNKLEGSGLTIRLGETSDPVFFIDKFVSEYIELQSQRYDVLLAPNREVGWVESGGSKQVLATSKIAEIWIHNFFNRVEKALRAG